MATPVARIHIVNEQGELFETIELDMTEVRDLLDHNSKSLPFARTSLMQDILGGLHRIQPLDERATE